MMNDIESLPKLKLPDDIESEIVTLLVGKIRWLGREKEAEFEFDTEQKIQNEVASAQRAGAPAELPDLDEEECKGLSESEQLEKRVEMEVEDRKENAEREEIECSEHEAAAALIADYQRMLENVMPVLSHKTWEIVNRTFLINRSWIFRSNASLRHLAERAREEMMLTGELQGSNTPDEAALTELDELVDKSEAVGIAGAVMEALKKFAELYRSFPIQTSSFERLWMNWCNQADPHHEMRWNVWRLRGGLFATTIAQLPEQFGVMHLGQSEGFRRLKDKQKDMVLMGFPTFGKGIPDSFKNDAEAKTTWQEKRKAIKERLAQKGEGPWTILQVEVTKDERTQQAVDASIVSTWQEFPEAWDTFKAVPDNELEQHFVNAIEELKRRLMVESSGDRLIEDSKRLKHILLDELNRDHPQEEA